MYSSNGWPLRVAVTANNQPTLSSRIDDRSDAPCIRGSRDGRASVASRSRVPWWGTWVVKLVTWFLKANETRHREAALDYERSRGTGAAMTVREAHDLARRALGSREDLLLGALEGGEELRVELDTLDRHNVIAGATGSGKTRAIIDRLLRRAALGLRAGFECEVFDPKTETFTELKKHLAAWCSRPTMRRARRLRARCTSSTGREIASRPPPRTTTATAR